MKRKTRRVLAWGMTVSAGFYIITTPINCVSFFSDAALSTVDMCFVFDCQNGAIGGLLDPCTQIQLFVDCPDQGDAAP